MSFSKTEAKTKVLTKKQFHQINLKVKRPFVESLNQVGSSSQVVQDTALKEKRPKTKRFKVCIFELILFFRLIFKGF